MTPRERLLAALAGESVVPIPVDIYEGGIAPGLEAGMCRHFGLLPGDHEGLRRALGAHVRWGHPLYVGPALEVLPGQTPQFPDRAVVRGIWGTVDGVQTYGDDFDRPLRSIETVAEVEAHAWPRPDWFDYTRLGWMHDEPDAYLPVAAWAELNADLGRWVADWHPVFSRVMDLFGMETGLVNLASRPDLIDAVVAHIGDFLEGYYTKLADSVRGCADAVVFTDDFAGQNGLLLSPRSWRRHFLPVWKRVFPIAHAHGMQAALHSCGSVRAVLGDLVDAGLDILEPVQTTAAGMDPVELKREFGAHLAFYGGVDTQQVLPLGTPDEVRAEVRRLAGSLGSGGRYVLTSCHFLQEDVPLENALAMFDEARVCRLTAAATVRHTPR
jgi:uroporphyrinogen decarboxylase